MKNFIGQIAPPHVLTLLALFFFCSFFFNCENKIDSEVLNLEEEILASREFTEFMNHHAGWQMRYALARVENTELLDNSELETLQTEFITKSNYNLDTEAGNILLKGFDFDSSEEFITYYNSYEDKKLALHEKFPQLGNENELFLKIQKQYIAELNYSDIVLEIVNTRNDFPGQAFTSVLLEKCTYNIDECPNFELNRCDTTFRNCVLDNQILYIQTLVTCWGDEFVFVDFMLEQECQYNFFGELVCFNDPPNVAGVQGIAYLLVGGGTINSIPGAFNCVPRLLESYFNDVCLPCQNIECNCG